MILGSAEAAAALAFSFVALGPAMHGVALDIVALGPAMHGVALDIVALGPAMHGVALDIVALGPRGSVLVTLNVIAITGVEMEMALNVVVLGPDELVALDILHGPVTHFIPLDVVIRGRPVLLSHSVPLLIRSSEITVCC
jgi:hypothetical protein